MMQSARSDKRQNRWGRLAVFIGLAAIALHQLATALGSTMPIAVAMAEASAAPGQIVICTANGPITVDADDFFNGKTDTGHGPRTACDLSVHAASSFADAVAATPLPLPPFAFAPAAFDTRPQGHLPLALRTGPSGPRAPPLFS